MCTLMQKDVLIELIASTQADLSKVLDLPLNEDQLFLSRLRGEIYRSEPEKIDFDSVSNRVKEVGAKYRPSLSM